MKKLLTVCVSTLVCFAAFGHEKNYTMSINISPTLNWVSTNIKNARNQGLSPGFLYGINATKRQNNTIGYLAGVYMSHTNFDIKYQSPLGFRTHDSLYMNIPSGSVIEYRVQHLEVRGGMSLHSREIGYTTIASNFGLFSAYNLKSKVNIKSMGIDGETERHEISLITAGYFVEGGILYSLGGSTAIKATITFASGFTDLTTDKHNSQKDQTLHSRIGLLFGIVF